MKQFLIGGSSILIAFGLFVTMSLMISPDTSLFMKKSDHAYLNFVRVKPNDRIAETKERKLPDEPPPPEQPPQTPEVTVDSAPTPQSTPQLAMNMPSMSMPLNNSGGPYIGTPGAGGGNGGIGVMDAEVVPLVQVPANYPSKAKRAKLEGYVKLSVVIRPDGSVSTAKVIESKPKRLFDKAAKDAILRWKFKPKMVDGKNVAQKATQVIEFKLSK
jgi:protein TonB